ncbi:hypothetical protein [Streptomyces sp. NBC_01205]|uniref:hypothetical protein n=2 Tax=unclassified Streptomyces TaxID=2593676 RepID=UPI002E0F9042|nr:hypothetical protein OG573_43500 [Streptomyces sp. NBC_01205]
MPVKGSAIFKIALAATIALSGAVATVAAVPTAAYAAPASSVNGKITRSEILQRAQYWVDQRVPYQQGPGANDSGGRYYERSDCSGYVSMAWHLGSALTTQSLRDVSYELGSFDDLKPGDILNRYDGGRYNIHVVLFAGWTDGTRTTAKVYTESDWGEVAKIAYMSRSALNNGDYRPWRYDNVIDDAVSAPAKPSLGIRGSVIAADGNQVTFTRDAGSGHLQVTYLPPGGGWQTSDLSVLAGTAVSAGGAPAAFVQANGTLGVVTADAANGHLRITYKPANGSWATSDLTNDVGAPVSDGEVTTQVDASGTLSVFSRNSVNGHANLTYLPSSGGWSNFDLTTNVGTAVSAGGAPAAFVQANGTLGVVTADAANGHLRVTYKPANGSWATSDLTNDVGAPVSDGKLGTAVDESGTLSVFSRNSVNGHANLTYLPSSGGWSNFDLTTNVGTAVSAGGAPAAFVQKNGTLGVVTADAANGHLRITYKPVNGSWATSDLTNDVGTPVTDGNVSSVLGNDGTLSVYSRGSANGHLHLTYLPTTGTWATTDMAYQAGTPTLD